MTNALTLPATLSASTLDHYIQSVNSLPLLSAEREAELARQLRDTGNLEAARELVMSHLRFVVSISRGYMGYGLPQADLIQEGNIGLMKAVKRYDPDRGVRLVSFAVHWIKAEIHEFILRNWRLVRVATTKAQRKLFFNLRSMKPGFASLSPQEVQDVADQLGVKPEEVREMEMRMNGHDIAMESQDGDEDTYAPIDYLAADEANDPLEQLSSAQFESRNSIALEQALASLDERSRSIIAARWLQEDGSARTLHDLAAEYSVSAERIRQIEQKAMQKIKQALLQHA